MAIYHYHLKKVCRRQGGSAVDQSAYLAREKLRCHRHRRDYDHTHHKDLYRSLRLGFSDDRSVFWGKAEAAEKRKDSVVARGIVVALPKENDNEKNWVLLLEHAQFISRRLGTAVDVAMHLTKARSGPLNPHGHLLIPTRTWDQASGTFGRKTREFDMPISGPKLLKELRKTWEIQVNRSLPADVKPVCSESHKTLRNGLLARKHLGPVATAMERRGIKSNRGYFNAATDEINAKQMELTKLKADLSRSPANQPATDQTNPFPASTIHEGNSCLFNPRPKQEHVTAASRATQEISVTHSPRQIRPAELLDSNLVAPLSREENLARAAQLLENLKNAVPPAAEIDDPALQ